MERLPRLVIAGTHSGVGKTTVSLALMVALRKRDLRIQGFKVGPDYIDPSHHSLATGLPSRNLDTWMIGKEACKELFIRSASRANISIIEGVMGLYDGHRDGTEAGSTAELAKLLRAPVILVLDAKGLARSAGAMVQGYRDFDPQILLAGVILNNVASERHYELLRRAIEGHCQIPVLGYIRRDKDISLPERYMGLVPSSEGKAGDDFYSKLSEKIDSVDMDSIIAIANSAGELPLSPVKVFAEAREHFSVRIALARDEAFHFYYEDNLELLRLYGAEIVPFSPLIDDRLPSDIDAVYIGGGFPELYAQELEANRSLRREIRMAAEKGVVLYSECGGMMYLLERLIDFGGSSYSMCGVLPGATRMVKERQDLGYVTVRARCDNLLCKKGETFRGHVFHWSSLVDTPPDTTFAYEVSKGEKEELRLDGLIRDNVLSSYVHVHFAYNPGLALNLLSAAKKVRV